jgi:hypothetical protein
VTTLGNACMSASLPIPDEVLDRLADLVAHKAPRAVRTAPRGCSAVSAIPPMGHPDTQSAYRGVARLLRPGHEPCLADDGPSAAHPGEASRELLDRDNHREAPRPPRTPRPARRRTRLARTRPHPTSPLPFRTSVARGDWPGGRRFEVHRLSLAPGRTHHPLAAFSNYPDGGS